MTTTAHILTMPVGTKPDLQALRQEFACTVVQHNWHPSRPAIPGVLHITCMHPEDLRAAGCHQFTERGWHAQPVAMPQRQRGHIQAGLVLDFCTACLLGGLLLGATGWLDGPSEDETAQTIAAEVEAARCAAVTQARFERAAQAACREENAGWYAIGPNKIQCTTRRGAKTFVAEVQP